MNNNFKEGDSVIFINELKHNQWPHYFPVVGTIGIIKEILDGECLIQWPENSTSSNNLWYCLTENLINESLFSRNKQEYQKILNLRKNYMLSYYGERT